MSQKCTHCCSDVTNGSALNLTSSVCLYVSLFICSSALSRFTIDGATVYAVQILYNLIQKEPDAKIVARKSGEYAGV